jgi:hypothetical protein
MPSGARASGEVRVGGSLTAGTESGNRQRNDPSTSTIGAPRSTRGARWAYDPWAESAPGVPKRFWESPTLRTDPVCTRSTSTTRSSRSTATPSRVRVTATPESAVSTRCSSRPGPGRPPAPTCWHESADHRQHDDLTDPPDRLNQGLRGTRSSEARQSPPSPRATHHQRPWRLRHCSSVDRG